MKLQEKPNEELLHTNQRQKILLLAQTTPKSAQYIYPLSIKAFLIEDITELKRCTHTHTHTLKMQEV